MGLPTGKHQGRGTVRIERRFTQRGHNPYEGINFVERSSEIKNPDGSTVFKLDHIGVPEHWSQLAIDILAQKYFRKAGVPQRDPNGEPLVGPDGQPVLGGERDARQVFHRLAGCWTKESGTLNSIVFLWGYEDFGHRASQRAKLSQDKEWQAFVPTLLPYLVRQESVFLVPAPFSPL